MYTHIYIYRDIYLSPGLCKGGKERVSKGPCMRRDVNDELQQSETYKIYRNSL